MSWEWLARGFAELGSPSGDGVNGSFGNDGVAPHGGSIPHTGLGGQEVRLLPIDSKFDVTATAGDYSSASQGQYADSSTGGEVSIPVLSSPLHKFDAPSSQERSGSDQLTHGKEPLIRQSTCASGGFSAEALHRKSGQPRGASIHSGDTTDRLMDAVERCEERSRI